MVELPEYHPRVYMFISKAPERLRAQIGIRGKVALSDQHPERLRDKKNIRYIVRYDWNWI